MWNMHCNRARQALRPLWCGEGWLKYKWGGLAGWLCHTPTNLPRQAPYAYNGGSKHQMAGNISRSPCLCWNTILAFEKEFLWKQESYNRIHLWNNLIDTWAKEHGTEWVYRRAHNAPASGKSKCYNGLLKTTQTAMCACAGMFKH